MYNSIQVVLPSLLLSTLLAASILNDPMANHPSMAQPNTTSLADEINTLDNLTGGTALHQVQTARNSTGDIGLDQISTLSNLTEENFGSIIDGLINARKELHHERIEQAYDALNAAGSEIFKLIARQPEGDFDLMVESLKPVQIHIEEARDDLQADNLTKALSQINAADIKLLNLILKASSS